MKKKDLLVLISVLLILLGVYILVIARKGKGTIKTPTDIVITADSTLVSQIEIYTSNDTVMAVKEGLNWQLKKPVNGLADNNAFERIVSSLVDAKVDVEISKSSERHGFYQVDDASGKILKVSQTNGKTVELIVGKTGAAGITYVRIPGSNSVWTTPASISASLRRRAADYREKKIFHDIVQEDIVGLDIQLGDSVMHMIKEDTLWMVAYEPANEKFTADNSKANHLLRGITNIRTTDFIEDADSIAKIDFTTPDARISVHTSAGKTIELVAVYENEEVKKFIMKRSDVNSPLYVSYKGTLEHQFKDQTFMTTPPAPPSNTQGMPQQLNEQNITPEMRKQIEEMMRKQGM